MKFHPILLMSPSPTVTHLDRRNTPQSIPGHSLRTPLSDPHTSFLYPHLNVSTHSINPLGSSLYSCFHGPVIFSPGPVSMDTLLILVIPSQVPDAVHCWELLVCCFWLLFQEGFISFSFSSFSLFSLFFSIMCLKERTSHWRLFQKHVFSFVFKFFFWVFVIKPGLLILLMLLSLLQINHSALFYVCLCKMLFSYQEYIIKNILNMCCIWTVLVLLFKIPL